MDKLAVEILQQQQKDEKITSQSAIISSMRDGAEPAWASVSWESEMESLSLVFILDFAAHQEIQEIWHL